MKNLNYFLKNRVLWGVLWLLLIGMGGNEAVAGVFNIPHFVNPKEFALGVEPELMMTGGAAMGVNLRYIQGVSDLSNFTGIIGTGGGSRLFRFGGNFTFDIFPDVEKQPGIGLAFQGLFVKLPDTGSFETMVIPYVHKSLQTEQGLIEPFLAIPIGLSLSSGTYKTISTFVLGSLFQHSEHIRSVLELGVSINNTYTYFSGGVIYYH